MGVGRLRRAGKQTTALQGVDTKAGARVRLTATEPNMALFSRPKWPSLKSNTSNRGHFVYPEERAKSTATVPTVSEGDLGGRITVLPDTPENIQSVRSGAGCHGGIKGVADNGGCGCYFSPPDPDKSFGVKGGSNRVRTITEDLVVVVSRSLEGGTATHEGKVGCLIVVDE